MSPVSQSFAHYLRRALPALLLAAMAPAATPEDQDRKAAEEQVLFGDLPRVEAVALHAQTLAEAPANVTVITAAEIRRYGYRTLVEALNSVRGFYATYDHVYHYVGVRGLSLPGDFNTRFLVMLNGHPLTDNIYNSNGFFGQDFGLDMDLVERIEIVRGPTSALYGSNGMLTNINVVTRSPVDGERLRVSVENGSGRERKAFVSSSLYLGGGANLLLAASAFDHAGDSLPGPSLGLPESTVSGADGEHGYHTFAHLIWRNWSFTGYFNSRLKQAPAGLGTSLRGDAGQYMVDGRDLVSAAYKRQAGPGKLQWLISYDAYRYRDRFRYPEEDGIETVLDYNRGDWINSQLTWEVPWGPGLFTAGVTGFTELRNEQYNVVEGERQDVSGRPDRGGALFAQQEWNMSRRWTLHAGLRLDDTRNFRRFLSPRLAVVYRPSPRTVYKLVYGHPFRNPSSFEQYYHDNGLSVAAAEPLGPEAAHTFEFSAEHQVARGVAVVVNGFHYGIHDVIAGVALPGDVYQYRNVGRLHSSGVELELSGRVWDRLEGHASAVFQSAGGGELEAGLPNSPGRIYKARLGVPFFRERLFLAGGLHYLSDRKTGSGGRLPGPLLGELTGTLRVHSRFDVVTGLRNAFDHRYDDPVYAGVDCLPGQGRSAFVKLVWRVWE